MHTFESTANIGKMLTDHLHATAPDIPVEVLRFGGAGLLAALAFLMLVSALRLLRSKGTKARVSKRINIPRTIQHEGVVVDLLNSADDDDIAVRCVITAVSGGKVKCEIVERLDVIKIKEGKDIVCIFAPMKTDNGKVNSFVATLLESDKSGRKADHLVLSVPTAYAMTARRKHTRKRVADQQFIRVKLWASDPYKSDISFEDASPQIGINSFATEGPKQSANAVVNISHGGLGLSIQNRVIPETCTVGTHVTINLFMFSFKEKTFKPYWYSGQIRSMEEGRPGFTRMGIEFNGSAEPCDETGRLSWTQF